MMSSREQGICLTIFCDLRGQLGIVYLCTTCGLISLDQKFSKTQRSPTHSVSIAQLIDNFITHIHVSRRTCSILVPARRMLTPQTPFVKRTPWYVVLIGVEIVYGSIGMWFRAIQDHQILLFTERRHIFTSR